MKRSRQKLYDTSLLVAAIGLAFLYLTDPYNKLSAPSFHQDPQLLDNAPESQKLPENLELSPSNPDYRSEQCRKTIYAFEFVKVSVIITVPALGQLPMTLKSMEMNTPRKYIQEVLVVDQGGLSEGDVAKLNDVVSKVKDGRFVRNTGKGHVAGRLLASNQAQGDVMVFLEAGVVVAHGWLEPILDALQQNPQSFVMPRFDKLSTTTPPTYEPNAEVFVPFIDRQLAIKLKPFEGSESTGAVLPVATVRREIFAAKAWYFRHIGKLSSEVGDMGGVHQELALRIWQCGGSILLCSCSHVAISNFYSPLIVRDPLNIWRINEMWIHSTRWDPFYTNNNRPNPKPAVRQAIQESMAQTRKTLHCQSNADKFIEKFLPPLSLFDEKPSPEDLEFQSHLKAMVGRAGGRFGLIRSKSAQRCLSPDAERFLRLGPCNPEKAGVPRDQMLFRFTHLSQLKTPDGRCATVAKHNYLRIMDCDNANEKWNYREQQSFVWEDSGQLLFWISKDCISHVMDPDPAKNGRPIPMKRNCEKNHNNIDLSTWEILY